MRRALVLPLLVTAIACQKRTELPAIENPLERLAGPTLGGPPLDPAPLAGKVVFVNFWSPG